MSPPRSPSSGPEGQYGPPHSSLPPARQGGSGFAKVLGGVLAVLALGIVVVLVLLIGSGGFKLSLPSLPSLGPAAAGASPSPSPSETMASPNATPSPPADDPEALTGATRAGWQGVAVEKRPIAYDVPPAWSVLSPGTIAGFENEDGPMVGMSAVAEYGSRTNACLDQAPVPAAVGTSAAGEVVPTGEMATTAAKAWAHAAYDHPSGKAVLETGAPLPYATIGGLSGHLVTVSVTVSEHECYPETAEVRVFSFLAPSGGDVYNLILYADTSGDQKPDPANFEKIISTVRPAQ